MYESKDYQTKILIMRIIFTFKIRSQIHKLYNNKHYFILRRIRANYHYQIGNDITISYN